MSQSDDVRGPNRREFLKHTAATLALGASNPTLAGFAESREPVAESREPRAESFRHAPIDVVRVGFVGLGNQGPGHVENFLKFDNVEIKALCDIVPSKVAKVQDMVVKAGKPRPVAYDRGPKDYERMCAEQELDLVYTATPWELHAPICIAAMKNGKHAATEVPMAPTLDELWQMVETSEKTKKHCVMMENCCYDRTEMMILNMVRQNIFGELLHAECGYLHDLRQLKLSDFYENRWRVKHSIKRDADLYPTHGLGPVAQWMDINRGNQFDYLSSMSTKSRGLNLWAAEHIGPNSPEAKQKYALGDVVNTLIKTKNGQTILITHDTDSPRPYSRKILLQGTKGIVRKYPEQKIHIEGRSKAHTWEDALSYRAEFEHPVWKTLQERSAGAGHGGMDFIEDFRLVQCLREGKPMDMDVYDGAAWSAVTALSERSIAKRSASVDFPDFTKGAWKTRQPLGIVTV